MESFERGQHVLVTKMDPDGQGSVRLGGHLMELLEDGYVVKVTHKTMPVFKEIEPEVAAAIRGVVAGMPLWRVKVACVWNRVFGWKQMDEATLRNAVAVLIEKETLEQMPDQTMLTELSAPITTFVSGGSIDTIEATADSNADFMIARAVAVFNAGMDAEIEKLYTEADEEAAKKLEEKETNDEHEGSTGPVAGEESPESEGSGTIRD